MTNIKLAVDVIGAHNLMPKDGEGSSSPFVEIYFEGQRFRTTIKEKDLNPVWNESFYINISDPSNLHCLTFHVSIYHHAKGTHSRALFLGKVSLTGTSIVRYSDAVVLHYPLEKRGIFSRIRGELALKVYTTDDQSLKFSIPLPAVESIPNHEASVNHGATTVMNTIPRTVSHDKSETRDTFHHLPNPSHNLQRDHSSAPTVSQHATKYGVDETKPESQPPQLVLMYSVSSSQLVYELKELSQVASVNQGATKQWVSRTFYSNNISANQGAIPTVMNAIPSTVAHDSSETSPTFHHLPNPGHHQKQHHSSAPAVSHHATTYGVDEMNPEPQPPQLVRMYSASSPQPVDVSLKETSPFLESRQVVGGSGIRAATFLLQAWHQASSMVKSLLIFTFMGFHEILLPLFAWFWQLLFRVFFFQLQWVCHENKEFPNMIRLKLTIDKESNRVLYAESNKDFVDVLLSFLTLPMGTIIRLAEKRSGIGCMDNLYESVETLDDKFLQTKACRTMLLKPKNACEVLCNKLVVKIDDINPAKHYICSKSFCSTQNAYRQPSFRLASAVKDSECICGGVMDKEVFLEYLQEGMSDGNGVFVKETQSFVITDDLCITPTSMSDCLEMVRNLGVSNSERIEEMVVTISEEEVLQLLKNSFLSKTPLTNTFLMREQVIDDHDVPLFIDPVNPHEILTNPIIPSKRFAKMKVKLLIDKASNRVLCLEAEEDFLDIVLSFLTFPLGYMLKILRGHYCSLGSMDSLYKSVRKLDVKYLNSSKYGEMLINPSLAPHFSCENQVLMIGEEMPTRFTGYRCNNDSLCLSSWYKKLRLMNPKLPGQVTRGGGFVKKQSSLLIYDDLVIRPCSPTSGILDLLRNNVRVSDTQIQEVEVGGEEVMALLVASLTSKSVLNSVFCPAN